MLAKSETYERLPHPATAPVCAARPSVKLMFWPRREKGASGASSTSSELTILLSCGADSHTCPGGAGDAGLCTWERTSTKNAHVTVPNRVLLEPPYLPSGASG